MAARNVYDTPPFTHAVRTNIVLDDDLLEEALAVTGARTKKEVVHLALRELVRSRRKIHEWRLPLRTGWPAGQQDRAAFSSSDL